MHEPKLTSMTLSHCITDNEKISKTWIWYSRFGLTERECSHVTIFLVSQSMPGYTKYNCQERWQSTISWL